MRDYSVDYFAVMNSLFKGRRIKDPGTAPISWAAADESIVLLSVSPPGERP
jgi:hypothetical protein